MGAGLLHLQRHLNSPAGTISVRKGQLAAGVASCCATRNRLSGPLGLRRRTAKRVARKEALAGPARPGRHRLQRQGDHYAEVVGGASTRTTRINEADAGEAYPWRNQ